MDGGPPPAWSASASAVCGLQRLLIGDVRLVAPGFPTSSLDENAEPAAALPPKLRLCSNSMRRGLTG